MVSTGLSAPVGRPSGIRTTGDYVLRYPDRWRLAVPAHAPQRRPPRRLGACAADLVSELEDIPDLGITVVPDGAVLGPHGWVFTSDGYFLADNTWFGRHATLGLLPAAFPSARRLKGTCLSIASDFASNNYGHFILDCLGRYALFEKAGLSPAEIDHIYCQRPISRSARATMEALGIAPEKCVWAEDAPYVRADCVLATSFPGTRRNYPGWLATFLRRARRQPQAGTRRVYIPRDGGRRLSNEPEILRTVREFGFQIYDFRQHSSEPDFFSSVSHVVGAHGAGLTNIVFCARGAKVLELLPFDHTRPYYYTLADASGLDYSYLVGQSAGQRPPGAFGPSLFDFSIDPSEFRAALEFLDGRERADAAGVTGS